MNPLFIFVVIVAAIILWLFLGSAFFFGEMFFDLFDRYRKDNDNNEE